MSEPEPPTNFSLDWSHVDQTSNPQFYIGLLDSTRAAALARARQDPSAAFAALDLHPGLDVLDVGCGTGDYLRLLASLIAPGRAVGVDLSLTLIDEARTHGSSEVPNLSFRVGDARELPFPDGSFDRVLANQVLLHLDDPWSAVAEMRRVLRPGGLLSIEEWDWDSTCLATTDRELGRRFAHLLCDHMHNGLIVRELPWQLGRLGFSAVTTTAEVRISRGIDAGYVWLIEPVARQLVRTHELTAAEGARLLEDLEQRAEDGRYFLARTYYSIVAGAASEDFT